ncbi:MAG TPA: stimulus-sensing domain-containing protein [Hyphomonadaceae bacterium]|nr:stimulus-sensing domain-containing protein [Hyphomonadaceae bacterium]
MWSPIARRILGANLLGLLILVVGALVLNEIRSSLVNARKDSLLETSQIISNFITDKATADDEAKLDDGRVRTYLKRLPLTEATRIRVFNPRGGLVADTRLLKDEIDEKDLPPIKQPNDIARAWLDFVRGANSAIENITQAGRPRIAEARSLEEEVEIALRGGPVFSERFGDNAERVLSLTVPISKVAAVIGSLTVETSDVAKIIGDERAALVPLIIVAVLVAIITSTLLTLGIARPVQQLAAASDRVRTGATERLNLGKLHNRKDELGDLAQAMEAMTKSLYDRIQENERFAADVAHELKNPLTSIRSAVETAQAVQDPAVRERMREVIAKDVIRLDRLISDISNLTRLEGEIVREKLVRVDLTRLLEDIVSIYADTGREGDAKVTLAIESKGGMEVMGRDGPLGQVIRNLVENAKSFSPPGGEVRVGLSRLVGTRAPPVLRMTVEDSGPGVPPDKLEKIFERFYTDRPKGSKFGNNSGLGLSIVRQIVETHRGRVWAENRMVDGKIAGARFVVELPSAPLDI